MRRTAFDIFHPAVALCYFVMVLAMAMLVRQPVYALITFAGALAYSVVLRGVWATARTQAWQLPLVALVALCNALLGGLGSTELAHLGPRVIYAESLAFGACMGLMLAGVMLWFSNASHVLTSDKVMALLGNALPTVGLMVSMTMRLVPQFVCQGGSINAVQRACTSAMQCDGGSGTRAANAGAGVGVVQADAVAETGSGASMGMPAKLRRMGVREGARIASVLMGWAMEDSLEAADAMKARGWGSCAHRTTYARYRFRAQDAGACMLLLALGLAAALLAHAALSQFQFYPVIGGFAPWWNYAPYVVLVAVPLVAEAWEGVKWRRWET